MITDTNRNDASGDAPAKPDPGPTQSGAAWKDGVTPKPSATAPSPTDRHTHPHPDGPADTGPDTKNGKQAEEAEPPAKRSALRRWLPAGLLVVGLAALWAKMKK
ncbi:hypothetical protein [Niveispirillum sp.]|uniref:hypothetical protein n=1 Tax=Niveispirillum sp. TaxID=1917217 RepID=UPI001B548C73|nr:hypothetical protein [Niveispirillum sp.]MBP7337845.1 hypothetical protein [Niveispirillum sp.]